MKSIYSIINKKLLFPAGELLYKSNILAEYKRLLKTDWYTRDQLENIQNYYLHSLVAHCYANVPYYRNLFDKLNIKPEEIRSKSDLVRLPILTKQIIRDNYQMLLSQDIKSRNIRKHSTGGSTGVPLQYITDTQGWSNI